VSTQPYAPAPDQVTRPDQLAPAAAREFSPLDDERIVAVWRTHSGFLVLTNLRVVSLWQRAKLFDLLGLDGSEWHEGPDFFLYALAPPRALGRFVEVEGAAADEADRGRFLVQDPAAVAAAIAEEIPKGRALWEARRARVQAQVRALPTSTPSPPSGPVREVVRVVVRVPCRYCGCLMDEGAARCPTCGAPQH
jgi:hypothetical protein